MTAQALTSSEPLVETTCIDSPGKLAVPLINYSGKPIKELRVRITNFANAKAVRSVQHRALKFETMNNSTVVRLPLDVADMLLIDR